MADTPQQRDTAAVLAEFAQVIAEGGSSSDILERLGSYCTELLGVYGVGVLLRTIDGGLEVATANTEAGAIVEKAEAELGEGPCTDALNSGEQVVAADLAAPEAAQRWPRFVPVALESGVRAIHALPLLVRGRPTGSVDLIADDVLNLTAAQLSSAQLLADVTMAYLANSKALEEKSVLAAQLQHALDSRVIIEQAKGKLSERRRITVTEAFELLRRHARSTGQKLHDVAGAFVRGDLEL